MGETVDSVISGAAAVFAGKSPFGGGRSKVSFFDVVLLMFGCDSDACVAILFGPWRMCC